MRDFNRPHPIHPADCACPRCDAQLLGGRRRVALEIRLCALIVAASCVGAAFAILTT